MKDVDVVILSTPLNRIPDIAPILDAASPNTVVIDTSNYYPTRDFQMPDHPNAVTSA